MARFAPLARRQDQAHAGTARWHPERGAGRGCGLRGRAVEGIAPPLRQGQYPPGVPARTAGRGRARWAAVSARCRVWQEGPMPRLWQEKAMTGRGRSPGGFAPPGSVGGQRDGVVDKGREGIPAAGRPCEFKFKKLVTTQVCKGCIHPDRVNTAFVMEVPRTG